MRRSATVVVLPKTRPEMSDDDGHLCGMSMIFIYTAVVSLSMGTCQAGPWFCLGLHLARLQILMLTLGLAGVAPNRLQLPWSLQHSESSCIIQNSRPFSIGWGQHAQASPSAGPYGFSQRAVSMS